jgi:hypothetical protein
MRITKERIRETYVELAERARGELKDRAHRSATA